MRCVVIVSIIPNASKVDSLVVVFGTWSLVVDVIQESPNLTFVG